MSLPDSLKTCNTELSSELDENAALTDLAVRLFNCSDTT